MDVAFAEAAGGDADEAGALAELGDGGRADVAHAGLEAAHELEDDVGQRAFVRDAAFDAFRDELAGAVLTVAVARAFLHRADGAHAAVGFEAAALRLHRLAGAFAGACQKRAEHDQVGAGGERFDDVARVADAAVGDDFHAVLAADAGDVLNGGELRHADAGNDAGGADRAGADADFHGAGSGGHEVARALLGDDVSGDDRHVGKRAEFSDHFHHVAGVASGGVDEQRVRAGIDQHAAAVDAVRSHADGGTAAELAVGILGGVGEGDAFFDVGAGDEPDETAVRINEREFLNPVLIENAAGFLKASVARRGDELLARRHHVGDDRVEAVEVADIAAGDHAFEMTVGVDDGKSGEAVFRHDRADVVDAVLLANGMGFLNDGVFRAFHPVNHRRLLVDRAGAVDDAHAALAGQGDRQIVFGNRVHGRGNDREKQRNTRRDVRGKIRLPGQNRAQSRHQKHVVK